MDTAAFEPARNEGGADCWLIDVNTASADELRALLSMVALTRAISMHQQLRVSSGARMVRHGGGVATRLLDEHLRRAHVSIADARHYASEILEESASAPYRSCIYEALDEVVDASSDYGTPDGWHPPREPASQVATDLIIDYVRAELVCASEDDCD